MTSAHVCSDPSEFAALASEWDALRRRSKGATPFQSHTWLHSWWQSYGRPGRLRGLGTAAEGRPCR